MPVDLQQPNVRDLGFLLAEAAKNVVFIVGAGLSRPAGVPLWSDFLVGLTEVAVKAALQKDRQAGESLAQRLSAIRDPWQLGDELQQEIPRALFVATVQRLLSPSTGAPAYHLIADLHPSGVVSFNLDRLAEEALDARPERRATANEPSKFQRFLLLSQPFLLQPHGSLGDPASWVLTSRARTALLKKNNEYRRFMAALFASRRLVVVGFRPSDFAFESLLLEDFRDPETEGIHHFWITSSLSGEERAWARQYGLATIEYEPHDETHPEIGQVLAHLKSFAPRVPATTFSYTGGAIDPAQLPSDEDLRGEHVEDIRRKLNAGARGLLDQQRMASHEDQMKALAAFLDDYSGSAHMAWLIKDKPGYDRFFGCRVVGKIGEGTFGHIWRVQDPVDGSTRALKLLRRELSDSSDFVEAFRRGVSAARILTRSKVEGMVRLVDSYEIPTCLLMEFIDGPTLAEVVANNRLGPLIKRVGTIYEVARIVYSAHSLPERVLHRDLKPSNVMLEGFYGNEAAAGVRVLDFDLSWYEGAAGRSLLGGARYQGYAAPEQLVTRASGTSTRHTGVDVFGLGMLLYFALTGQDPEANAQKAGDFEATTKDLISQRQKAPFRSVIGYLAALVRRATCDKQADRIGLPAFIDGLALVLAALRDEELVAPSDLLLVELLEGLAQGGVWQPEPFSGGQARLRAGAGEVRVMFQDLDAAPTLTVEVEFNSPGDMRWSAVGKYVRSRVDQVRSILHKGGFEVSDARAGGTSLHVTARRSDRSFSVSTVRKVVEVVHEAANRATF